MLLMYLKSTALKGLNHKFVDKIKNLQFIITKVDWLKQNFGEIKMGLMLADHDACKQFWAFS